MFTGLTAEERAWSGNTTTGHRLTCACISDRRLTPLQWMDVNGVELPDSKPRQLVDFKVPNIQPGSAVNLRINKAGFSCAEAGNYTCVVGNNTRTVLVTPVGECGKQCVQKRLKLTTNICRSSLLCVSNCMCPTSAGEDCSLLPPTPPTTPSPSHTVSVSSTSGSTSKS